MAGPIAGYLATQVTGRLDWVTAAKAAKLVAKKELQIGWRVKVGMGVKE